MLQLVPVKQVPTAKQSPLPLNVYMCAPPLPCLNLFPPCAYQPNVQNAWRCSAKHCFVTSWLTLRMHRRLHGLAHIELNAIDLALDTVARFSSLPLDRVRTHRSRFSQVNIKVPFKATNLVNGTLIAVPGNR